MGATDEPASPPARCHDFEVLCLPSAQSLMRILGFFAQRDLLPLRIDMRRGGDAFAIRIAQAGLDDHQADVTLAKMRVIPDVLSADVTFKLHSDLSMENLVLIETQR